MADGSEAGPSRPDWIVPGLRCALEVTLIVLSTAYLVVQVDSAVFAGLVLVAGTAGSVLLITWCIKQQIVAWIRYATALSRRRRSARG